MGHRWIAMFSLGLLMPACEILQPSTGQFHALFVDAGGLRDGAAVYVAGVRQGRVGTVKLERDRARVDFTLDKGDAVTVREDACVSVGWYGAGDAHLVLQPGSAAKPVLAGTEITCVEEDAARAKLTLEQARTVIEDVAKGKGTLGRLLRDEKLADKVEKFFEQGPPLPAPDPPTSAPPGSASGALPPPPSPSNSVELKNPF